MTGFGERSWFRGVAGACFTIVALVLGACTTGPEAPPLAANQQATADYVIGPGDSLQIMVWRSPELSASVPVRPDGRISTPLVEDLEASGKTPTTLARDLEGRLKKFVADPVVTVMVNNFIGAQQVRIVGEAVQPKRIPYMAHMTVLDAMIEVGGLTPYAAGNRTKLVRVVNGHETDFNVRLDDLLTDGDMTANTELQPGDVIIIPQTFF
jgi:polysaccharide export outer membrane protein